jgi:hypothetical protein
MAMPLAVCFGSRNVTALGWHTPDARLSQSVLSFYLYQQQLFWMLLVLLFSSYLAKAVLM